MRKVFGFTLAELLIALAILGVIATFTIPKVLQSQQDSRNKAVVKEAAASIVGAYDSFKLKNTPSATTTMGAFTSYLNYVKVDSTTTIDREPSFAPDNLYCGAGGIVCLKLHSGAMVLYFDCTQFGGTGTTNSLYFLVDPDGIYTGSAGSKPQKFILYYNNRISTIGTALTGSTVNDCGSPSTFPADPAQETSWFNWN